MQVPDEAARRYPVVQVLMGDGVSFYDTNGTDRAAFIAGAEWARKEAEAERDEALKALSEARARYGDVEARLVEAEALIATVRDEARAGVEQIGDDFEDYSMSGLWVYQTLAASPSVVLADHDAAVWDEGYDHGASWSPAGEVYPERSDNPYRNGDNR